MKRKRKSVVAQNNKLDSKSTEPANLTESSEGDVENNAIATETQEAPPAITPTKAKQKTSVGPASQADHSAKRKSASLLLQQANQNGMNSDEDELGLDYDIAQQIYNDQDEDEDIDLVESETVTAATDTPSKKPRGRPKGYRRPKTPTPPPHLPSFHRYFFQNRPRGVNSSSNTLSSLSLISHEDYFRIIDSHQDSHASEKQFLHSIHSRSFNQWIFELLQGFNLCLYGWGSKRGILHDFARHFSEKRPSHKIVIVNGYNAALTPRLLLDTLASAIASIISSKPSNQPPPDSLTYILKALSSSSHSIKILLAINSIDGFALRRPAIQSLLSRLATLPQFSLVATADNPQFPLLWSRGVVSQFNWVFHDCTTFQSYDMEVSKGGHSSVVDEVNALLGRSGRKLQGREGVMYVLRSLTANARNLYALLINELLSLATNENDDPENVEGQEVEEDETMRNETLEEDQIFPESTQARASAARTPKITVPTHALYSKAVAQLITTNEVNYVALLKEFYDHEMLVSQRDAFGSEVLGVPFRQEEMEIILADLVGEGQE